MVFIVYYINLIVLTMLGMMDSVFLQMINLVYTLVDSVHNGVFLLFGFTMMNVDIHFDVRNKSPNAVFKKIRRIQCISRTIVASQILINILWILSVLYLLYGNESSKLATHLNIFYDLLNIFVVVPMNVLIYLSFWGITTRLQKVFKVLQVKRVQRVIYSVYSITIAMLVASEISLIVELVSMYKNQNVIENKFLRYFYYPALRSMNVVNDCM